MTPETPTSDFVGLVSWVHEPYLNAFLATCHPALEDNLMLWDGRMPSDPGLAGAINMGVAAMYGRNADWLVVLNPALRFGPMGGTDIAWWLSKVTSRYVFFTEAPAANEPFRFGEPKHSLAWHCCAIHREVFDAIGLLDPNFHPVYFEDVDFDLRYQKYFGNEGMEICPIDVRNESMQHSTQLAGVEVDTNRLIAYFATKWGRHPMATDLNSYFRPFNDASNPLAYWPPAGGQHWDDLSMKGHGYAQP